MRAAAMTEADVVLLIGRKLDYQVGYGSPAVFPHARFIRIADNAGELIDNRRGEPELLATPALALAAMVEAAGNREPALDKAWADGLRTRHRERMAKAAADAEPATGEDGKIHPRAIFDAIAEHCRSRLHRDRRRRRSLELRPHRPAGADLHGCRRLRLPRRRRAVRDRGGARHARTAR